MKQQYRRIEMLNAQMKTYDRIPEKIEFEDEVGGYHCQECNYELNLYNISWDLEHSVSDYGDQQVIETNDIPTGYKCPCCGNESEV